MATVLRFILILSFLQVVSLEKGLAQSVGDYRSRQTGAWNDINTWERWNGSAWVNPTLTEFDAELYDMSGVANNPFTIRPPHIVTVTADVLLMNVGKVETGAKLVVSHAALFYNNGADLVVSGTLETAAGGFIIDNAIAGTLNFNLPGSTYIHNRDGGEIPNALWTSGSLCLIRGVQSNVPTNLTQLFSDFTWDCAGQTANLNLDGLLNLMSGSLHILNTNGSSLALTSVSPLFLDINDLYIDGANTIFYLAKDGTGSVMINCSGSFIQVNGSTRVGSGHNVTIDLLQQNFLHQAGTIIVENNATFRVNFNGATPQQWQSIPTQITGNANFVIDNPADVEAISDIAVPGQYLEFNLGKLILNDHNLHLGLTTAATGTPSSLSFIDTNGQGVVIKATDTANPSFTFPVGSDGIYAPINIDFTIFTPPVTSGTVSIRSVAGRHPTEPSVDDYLNRYWEFISTIPGQFNATAHYNGHLEVTGDETKLYSKYFYELNGVWFREVPANIPLQTLVFNNLNNLIFSGIPRTYLFSAGEELSIEVSQPNQSDLCKNITDSQAMMLIKIYNAIPAYIPMLTDINLHTRGSTDPVTDLAEVTFNYSSTGSFDPSAFLLGTVMAPNGPFTVNTFGWPITHGWNYFWVGYKLTPGASLYNVLDVACESIVIDMNTIIPSTTDPLGNRQINQPPAIAAGIYTIGVGGTYTHFYEAVQDLNCRGVNGPVVFEFLDADYNTTTGEFFPVTIKTPTGVNATNTVTFRPAAGVDTKIEGQTSVFPQTGLIILEGSDYITFDGSNNGSNSRNLTIQNNSTFISNCAVIHLKSKGPGEGATHNVIKNCNLVGFGGSYFFGTPIVHGVAICGSFPEYHLVDDVGTPGPNNDHNTIENCSIEGTHTGIFVAGDAANPNNGLLIKDNEIGSQSNPGLWLSVSGITCLNTHHATIENNLIQNIKTDQPSAFNNLMTLDWRPAPPTGIVLGENMHDALLHNNRILGVETVLPIEFGAKGIDISGVNSMNITVSNNVIAGVLADGSQTAPTVEGFLGPIGNYIDHSIIGLYIDNVSGCKVSHNTIHLSGQRLDNGSTEPVITAAFAVGPNATDLKVTNNIFNNTLTASNTHCANYNYATYGRNHSGDAFASQFATINYNLYNASSTGSPAPVINNIGLLNGNDASNLASWQNETNQDISSINVDVSNAFVDPLADLRIKLNASESWYLSGTGVHDSDNPLDADGVARPAAVVNGAPDLGAYEFDANVLIANAQPVNAAIIPVGPIRNVYVANRLIGQFEFTTGTPPTLTAKYYSGIWPPDPTNNGLNPNAKYFNCYLKVDATGGSGYIYNHTYHYDEALIGQVPNEASIRPAKGEGTPGSWVYYTTGFTLDMAANTFTKPGLNSFSDFTGSFEDIIQASGQLWLSGQKIENANMLTWRYEAKSAVLFFELEHSNNGESWAPLYKSNQTQFKDVEAYSISRYYRVKAVLVDGSMMYSNTIHINGLNSKTNIFTLFPNPVQRGQKLILHTNQPVDKLEVYDHTGKRLYQTANDHERFSIPIEPDLPTGVYTLRIYGLFGTYAKRFLVH